MNLSHRWLQSLLPGLDATPDRLIARFAELGTPVDEVVDLAAPLRDIIVARVVDVQRHPNADRLSLCRVDAGLGGELLGVVCGAPNVKAGALYPFAPVGARLPEGMEIRKAKIRGETSEGMLCSARELGLGRDHEGIMELRDGAEPGQPLVTALGLDDVRYTIDVTPNRPDLLSHHGVARELGEAGEASIVLPALPGSADDRLELIEGAPEAHTDSVRVTLEDRDGCPRYLGIVIRGVRIGSSPEWLQGRLRAIGLRPINNVVDATNYVLHEVGQPMHAFDLAKSGDTIVVRRARAGESLVTLDGQARKLTADMLVIADARRPIALAGVMGGLDTEVTDATTDVLLECALFDPTAVRRTRKGVALATDASQRFERGVDPAMMERAARRATALIVAVAGGRAEPRAVSAGERPPASAPIRLTMTRVRQVLGVDIDAREAADLLEPLGFAILKADTDTLLVGVPGHRRYDVARADDLIEEIARRRGYDSFPDELRSYRPGTVPDDPLTLLERRVRDRMVAEGLLECRSVPFASEAEGDVALLLPLSTAESRLRRAVLSGLLHRVELNFSRGTRDIRLFEIGTVFRSCPGAERPVEETRLAVAFTGARTPSHWSGAPESFDLWDAKGLAERVAGPLGLRVEPAPAGSPLADLDPLFEPRTTFCIIDREGRPRGMVGRVRAGAVDAPAWAEPVWALEVGLDAGMAAAREIVYVPLPEYPAIERDLAFIVPDRVSAGELERALRGSAGPLLEHLEVFDLYRGKPIAKGSRSLAFRLRFRAPDRTLTDEEIDPIVARLVRRLAEEHGVQQRA